MTELPPPSEVPPPRRGLAGYVVIWLALTGLALTYLVIVASRPELVAQLKGEAQEATAAVDDTLTGDSAAIRKSLGQIQMDLARLKTDVQAQSAQDKATQQRIAALEQRFDTEKARVAVAPPPSPADIPQTPPSPAPSQTAAAAAPPAKAPSTVVPTIVNAAKAPAPAAAPAAKAGDLADAQLLTIPAQGGLETGSVATPAAAAGPVVFGPATVKAPPTPMAVQIANGNSVDALRLSWSLLSERHAALGKLEPRYTTGGSIGGPDQTFDLMAGPFKSTAEARRVCRTLESKGVPCKVAPFSGDAL